ncbi:hypothetical protein ACH4OY_18585 [Micromonospora rubida]|uniref:Uncharacterized protein n=1 Tax=Micromonospora rubida TaxID=2697657 RepID=A0ABW7SQ73_9ACTN
MDHAAFASAYGADGSSRLRQLTWSGSTILSASLNEVWRSDPPSRFDAYADGRRAEFKRVGQNSTGATADN